jgi:hypothetical protein
LRKARAKPAALVARLAALVASLTACATGGLTPEQARVYDQFAVCQSEGPTVHMVDVHVDGRFALRGRHSHIQLVRRCLSERFGYGRWSDPRISEQPVEPGGGL